MQPLTIDELRAAARVIEGHAVVTPVASAPELDRAIGASVLCKVEALQRTGSFKFRGAFHRLTRIPEADRPTGVVAVSSGNHGAAVACAAAKLAIPATVFIPEDAPMVKRALVESFGAEVVTFPRTTPDREAGARQRVRDTGATFVHPFEDRDIMLGQGTAGLELHDEVGDLDLLVVPMSGGGLMAGCGSALRALDPTCVLVGVEPEAGDDTKRSFEAGHPVSIPQPVTIADGLAVPSPGANTLAVNLTLVERVVTVSEEAIVGAMALLHDALGLTIEPSGAAGIAALLTDRALAAQARDRRVGVILSGGNVDPDLFDRLVG